MKSALTLGLALLGIVALLTLNQALPSDSFFAALSKTRTTPVATAERTAVAKPREQAPKTVPPSFSLVATFNR